MPARRSLLRLLPSLLLAMGFALPATGQSTDDCMGCHSDSELTKNEAGRVVSLYLDLPKFEKSVHGRQGIDCVSCHADLAGAELPHEPELAPPDCSTCHDEVAALYAASLHGRAARQGAHLAPRCWDCHGEHDILPPEDPEARTNRFHIPFMCGRCHKEGTPVSETYDIPQDSILTHYSQSMHGEGLYHRGLTISAVCTDCHTSHQVLPHTDPASSISRGRVAQTCMQCHGRIEEVHQKVIAGELWEKEPHKVPVCVECHEPHRVRRVFYEEGMSDRECLGCHGSADSLRVAGPDFERLLVDQAHLKDSAHERTTCVQCHTGATPSLHRACATVKQVDCSICHAEVVATYREGLHGELWERGDQAAPSCIGCHGTHQIMYRRDPRSPTYVQNEPALCARCHGAGAVVPLRRNEEDRWVDNYNHSVHGRALSGAGLVVSATCSDCHTAHHVMRQVDPRSSIHRSRIAETCAACHKGVLEEFRHSIHWTGEPRGGKALPMCDDCHSSHEITRTDAEGFRREIVSTCGHCHEDVTESYFDTFHGKVVKLGYTDTAKCQDCHGAHGILPPTDPHSSLSRQNIVATCAKCHPGSHRRFAGYLTHATHHDRDKYPFIYWTWMFMTSLLVGTFLFFGVHTLLWLPRSFQAMRHTRRLRNESGGVWIRRFDRMHRQLHILVIISFLGLAVTGMTLKFAYLPWAQWLSHVMGGFKSAGVIHRICAVITFYYFARHLVWLARRKAEAGVGWRQFLRGRKSMLPNRQDGADFVQTLRWFVGIGPRPRYGHWAYWEKFDYFAVFWGVMMIGFSGLVLWFPEFFTRLLPGSFINVATIIHSDEALLATGFIFTVHFFNTHFRPDRFPMDPVIFTGRVSLEEFKEDRPREYEALVASGELEQHLTTPPNPSLLRAFRFFGLSALTVGLGLVVLIIWAEIFGYR